MVLGVMEGLIRGGYYLDSIFDPSAIDRNVHVFCANGLLSRPSTPSIPSIPHRPS